MTPTPCDPARPCEPCINGGSDVPEGCGLPRHMHAGQRHRFSSSRPCAAHKPAPIESGAVDAPLFLLISGGCHSGLDGECSWEECPQIRDGEPNATGRHCPLDRSSGNEEW